MAQSNTATMNPWLIDPPRRRGLQIASALLRRSWWLVGIATAIIIVALLWQNRTDFATGSSAVTIDRSNIYVSDNANLLSSVTRRQIKQANRDFAKLKNQPQLLVVTVDHLPADQTIEEFTNDLANKLGVGDAAADSGVVYLLAKREHQARLEIGYGLESTIPDADTDLITDSQVKNFYRQGNYDAGISLVTRRIRRLIETGELGDTVSAPSTDLSWRATWLWLTGSTVGQIIVVIALLALGFGSFQLVCFGRRLQGRLLVDQLWRHYAADMHSADDSIAVAAALTLTPSDAVLTARKQIAQQRRDEEAALPEGRLARRPDYWDMNFAFGSLTPEKVVASAESLGAGFKTNSVYLHHWRSWYGNRGWGNALYATPAALVAPRDRKQIAPNLLSPLRRRLYRAASFVLIHWASTALVLVLVGLYARATHLFSPLARLLIVLNDLIDNALQVLNILDVPHGILYAFGILLAGVYLWLNSVKWTSFGALLRQRLRLDAMMRRYLADLRTHNKALGDDQELAQQLDMRTGDSAVTQAERAVASANNHKNKKRADYADMAFAMGSITNARFLISGLESDGIRNSSMVDAHQDDWYRPSSDSGAGGSSGGSSGGDSFGGGDFGGGGGTSSW